MQFENRFDELKHKLDLIPDAEVKSEVFTIKRKVMPAYAMMVVLLMLVTGIIGLQFGLNSDFVEGPEIVDSVESKLMELVDVYEREAATTVVIQSKAKVHFYVGIKDNQKVVVAYLNLYEPDTIIEIECENATYSLTRELPFVMINLNDLDVNFDISASFNNTITFNYLLEFDFTPYYSNFME